MRLRKAKTARAAPADANEKILVVGETPAGSNAQVAGSMVNIVVPGVSLPQTRLDSLRWLRWLLFVLFVAALGVFIGAAATGQKELASTAVIAEGITGVLWLLLLR